MERTTSTTATGPTSTALRVIFALLVAGLAAGATAGTLDWILPSEGVPPGATFPGWVAWRSAIATARMAICLAVVSPLFVRAPEDRWFIILFIAGTAVVAPSRYEGLFGDVFVHSLAAGFVLWIVIGVLGMTPGRRVERVGRHGR